MGWQNRKWVFKHVLVLQQNGRDSNRKRQIDILIIEKNSYLNPKIAIECKNFSEPVDVSEIEKFATKLKDVNILTGIMFSNSGFTSSAINMAGRYDITLSWYPFDEMYYAIQDYQEINPSFFYFTGYFVVEQRNMKYFVYYGICNDEEPFYYIFTVLNVKMQYMLSMIPIVHKLQKKNVNVVQLFV